MDPKKLAVIHIIKKELNLTDAEYRNILQAASGVMSAKDLDEDKFKRLMNYFVRSRHYRVNRYGLTLRQKLFIQSLVHELEWNEEHLRNFLSKYYHKEKIDQLSKAEAMKVIESLKNIRFHQAT
jgi:hypothetical protein